MATLSRRSNGHNAYHQGAGVAVPTCPYCGAEVSRPQFKEIQARLEMEERARIAKIEADLKARVAREVAKVEATKKTEIELASKAAVKHAEKKLGLLRAGQQATIDAALKTEREKAAREKDRAVAAERAKAFKEQQKRDAELKRLQRRNEQLTAHELGEPAEVELYDALASALPDDRVSRVAKGVRGPDVLIEVVHHGEVAGRIIVDAKNHSRWSNSFISKLKADQLAEGADFAILSTAAFPKGTRQLHIQDGVIIADPARVVALLSLLRRQVIQNHAMKLSADQRSEKADKLYEFIMSPVCTDIFDRLKKTGDDLIDLEAKEVDAHHGVWRRRGELIRSVHRIHEELTDAVSLIIGGAEPVTAEASA